jgi:hypothetical protein
VWFNFFLNFRTENAYRWEWWYLLPSYTCNEENNFILHIVSYIYILWPYFCICCHPVDQWRRVVGRHIRLAAHISHLESNHHYWHIWHD